MNTTPPPFGRPDAPPWAITLQRRVDRISLLVVILTAAVLILIVREFAS